jgi:hypothetical protein
MLLREGEEAARRGGGDTRAAPRGERAIAALLMLLQLPVAASR